VQTARPISLNSATQYGEQGTAVRSIFDVLSDKQANPGLPLSQSLQQNPAAGFGRSKIRFGA
jgi:hypothetical protein